MKIKHLVLLSLLLLINSTSTTYSLNNEFPLNNAIVNISQTNSTINFHHSFEESINPIDYGYYWNEFNSQNQMTVSIATNASYSGNQSLVIKSNTLVPPTSMFLNLNLNFEDSKYFSLYIFVVGFRHSIIRVNIADEFGNSIGLDFGQGNFGWEPSPIFDMNIVFQENNWDHLSRNLTKDIEVAITFPGSPYTSFVPSTLMDLEIFQPWDGIHLNYLNDIMFDEFPIDDIEFSGNSIVVDPTITETETTPFVPQRTLTSQTSNEPKTSSNVDLGLVEDALPLKSGMVYLSLILLVSISFKRRK